MPRSAGLEARRYAARAAKAGFSPCRWTVGWVKHGGNSRTAT
jgi:hypothetical protein